ncbi:MAG TPA: hypothetical protein VIP11_06345 [Gemmatimonadaceae bacterium]
MYDPSRLPEWLTTGPSAEELQARADLREVYAAIDEEPDGPRFLELWDIARDAEDELTVTVDARVAAEIEAAEAGTTASSEFSLSELGEYSGDDSEGESDRRAPL